MAGIGIRLNKIFNKNTLTANLAGFGYSVVITIAPMLIVIAVIILMQLTLGFSKLDYTSRELYSCTVLYIFIFGFLLSSPYIALLSRYMSDLIYEEKYSDIPPCFYTVLLLNVAVSFVPALIFCIHEWKVGGVDIWYVFAGFVGFMGLTVTYYIQTYLSLCKEYGKISRFYIYGMVITYIVSLFLYFICKLDCGRAMLYALDVGLVIIASLEYAQFRRYFKENSGNYFGVFAYFKKHFSLVVTNFCYTLGLYAHNFIFWTTDMRMVVVKSFVCVQPYDMASCIAMFTNISSSVIFLTRVEMNFHEKYRDYSEAVIGGRRIDIITAKNRMFKCLIDEIVNLTRIQFIVSAVTFLICMIILPRFGFGGQTMKIYPCLAVGYYIMYLMYAIMLFLYYYYDFSGALLVSVTFLVFTAIGAFIATHLTIVWYGSGLVLGALISFTVAYFRVRYIEKTLDVHIFCRGNILKKGHGRRPYNKVYERGM